VESQLTTSPDSLAVKARPLVEIILLIPGYNPFDQAGECWFDEAAAQQAIDFVQECCRLAKGSKARPAGSYFVLEDWQKAIVANLFGWKRPDGTRRYRECLIYIGKKNGKTALLAAILLCVMCCDKEYGAELYSAAASKDQAALLFSHASGMVKLEPELSNRLTVYGAKGGGQSRAIVYPDMMGSYKCLSADADTGDGINPHFAAIDELHRHASPELAEIIQKSTASRAQPLVIYTTTADYNRPSLCNTMRERAGQVRDNKGDESAIGYDPSFLPVIYEAAIDDDWTQRETWLKANPNLGVTITEEFLARECKKAQETPSELNNFLRLHLNIKTQSDVKWLDGEKWALGNRDVDDSVLAGLPCWGGLDLATTTDLAAFVRVWRVGNDYVLRAKFYAPKDNAEKRQHRDHVPYLTWAKLGFLTLTEGSVIDYDVIRRDINELASKGTIQDIGVDPHNATQLTTQLEGDGLQMIRFGQGFISMSAPSKEFERLILSGRLIHGGNPILDWMAGNVVIKTDAAGNIKPDKAKSAERIDGIVAAVMAVGRAMVAQDCTPGIIVL
jgi:phage terminase large subunit-like protein